MKLLDWVQFNWDLTRLPPLDPELPEHYQIAAATRDDETEVRKIISSSFVLDPVWSPAMHDVMRKIDLWLDRAFASETISCLALRHGLRIIGASVISVEADADNHLAPGPCVLMEYRNRGFGTTLLESSLKLLQDAGLARAVGIAREHAPVARFLYPKFGGMLVPADPVPLLAA
jgi:hypothetical protein